MEQKIYPVDVICVCEADGTIRPLRLRLEDELQRVFRVDIDEVISKKSIPYVGVESQVFLCRARAEGRRCVVELKYYIRTHSWRLLRRVS